MNDLKNRIEPLVGGIQIQSRKKRGIGTLACVVFDKQTKKPLGLTNKHILKKRRGFSVIQPAKKPRTKEYIIGTVLRKGGRGRSNDFAVFEININNRSYDTENSIYGLKGKLTEYTKPEKGMKVQKIGQTTGHTFGIIQEVYRNTVIIVPNYDKQETNVEISKGGDSGALWVTDEENFKAVALHRAGEPNRTKIKNDKAFAIPIKRVLNVLNITLTQ